MRQRVTILALMGVVAVVALGAVALREANELWASVVFTLTLGILGLACLGAAFRRGRSRAAFAGFAGFGLGYLYLCFGPWASTEVRPHLATDRLVLWAVPRVVTQPPLAYQLEWLVGGDDSPHIGGTLDLSPDSPPARRLLAFSRVGHSLFALLAALIGGLAARHFHDTRTPQPPAPRGDAP